MADVSKLYQKACQHLDIAPREAMYIGDNPVMDIDPTNQLGMITVRNQRGSHYDCAEGKTKPEYIIQNFRDLLAILKRDFDLDLTPE